MRPHPLAAVLLALAAACGDSGDTSGGGGSGGSGAAGGSGGSGGGGAPSDVESRCAEADAELGVERPEGWSTYSHCKFAIGDVEKVFPSDRVLELTIVMTSDEYDAMKADLQELMGGEGGVGSGGFGGFGGSGGDGGLGGGGGTPPEELACEGLLPEAPCEVDFGGGLEPGICLDAWAFVCIPLSWLPPQEWIDACAGLDFGEPCEAPGHTGVCDSDGFVKACFPTGPGPSGGDPCEDKGDGDDCQQGQSAGTCLSTTGPLICQADGFDDANVDGVPEEAAAPFWERKPNYFHADVLFDGQRWENVGIRYKGNNGLASSVGPKKPLRFKFDEWESEHPEIDGQRFWGFQHLSLSPNHTDPSHMHQVLAAEVFRRNGVAAPQAGWVEIYLDIGEGPELLGLYALTEIPDNPLLDRAFGSSDGNLYKPDGQGAHLVSFVEPSFHKKNNEDSSFADVVEFIDALHADQSDRAAWREGLRETFDIDAFCDAYAVNQVISNWDTYGGLAHNFYFYGDPSTGQLVFIPWDFDLAFDSTGFSDLTLSSFDGNWPLLQAVARDVEFGTRYRETLASVAAAELTSGALADRVDQMESLIEAAVARDAQANGGDFDSGLSNLRAHIESQTQALESL